MIFGTQPRKWRQCKSHTHTFTLKDDETCLLHKLDWACRYLSYAVFIKSLDEPFCLQQNDQFPPSKTVQALTVSFKSPSRSRRGRRRSMAVTMVSTACSTTTAGSQGASVSAGVPARRLGPAAGSRRDVPPSLPSRALPPRGHGSRRRQAAGHGVWWCHHGTSILVCHCNSKWRSALWKPSRLKINKQIKH